MDVLGEHVGVKTAAREGPFNLQCKYLSISAEREEGPRGRSGGDNGGVFQSFSFCCCCLRAGRGLSSSPLFLNCEARRLVRVLPTFHPKQRSHQILLPSDTGVSHRQIQPPEPRPPLQSRLRLQPRLRLRRRNEPRPQRASHANENGRSSWLRVRLSDSYKS